MNNHEIEMMVKEIDEEISPFMVPILVGATSQLMPDSLQNGTGLLLRNETHVLVTCNHLWEHWRTANDGQSGAFVALLGNGYTAVEVKPGAIFSDAEADVAMTRFPPSQITDGQKSYYPMDKLGVAKAKKGETLVAIGYPGMWRDSNVNGSNLRYSLLPFEVTDTSPRAFVAAESVNANILKSLDQMAVNTGRKTDALGGLSGAPVFNVYERPFRLAGFLRSRGAGGVWFAHASVLG